MNVKRRLACAAVMGFSAITVAVAGIDDVAAGHSTGYCGHATDGIVNVTKYIAANSFWVRDQTNVWRHHDWRDHYYDFGATFVHSDVKICVS